MRTPLLALTALALAAQPKLEFWPNTAYDPAIPTFHKVLGHEPGERILSHANLMRYLDGLAAAAPNRIKVFEYAKSWEGRKLVYAAVGSEANIRRLPEIQAAMRKLADPRASSEAEARKIMATLPAVIWLGYGIHGNEISSPDAALLTAYHLLAARKDKVVDSILAGVVVLIDPTQNPDGRDRFVHNFEQAEGIEPDAHPSAAEHNEPWPGGRTNHYYFDLNRDFFALTQPETRGRVRALLEWHPLVFVDLHEMGSNSTYYFAPEAVPFNPHLTKEQKQSLDWFGKNNAGWFDQFGFSYFTREVYDAFYPGYGSSWPSYYGSIAMTYENASSRGLLMRRADDTVFHFRDTVQRHFVASISTAEAAAKNREALLANFYRYGQSAVEEGSREPVREYVLPRRGDIGAVDRLATLLARQGIEVRRARDRYVIPLAQPAKRLIRTLLDSQVSMEDFFLQDEERRRRKKLSTEIYDVTGWSMPLLYNVEAIASSSVTPGPLEKLNPDAPPARPSLGKAAVAYLVPWGDRRSAQFLTAALRAGLRVHSSDKAFTQNGRQFPRGTLIVKVKENASSVHETVARIAGAAEIVPTGTGWVEDGVNFGSRHVQVVPSPAIALAWDRPTAAGSAGATRFVLERQFHYPVTPVRTAGLSTADLSKFQVLILPDSTGEGYAAVLGPNGPRRLKDWVTAGGTLIGIRGGMAFLADPKTGLLAVAQENLAAEKPAEAKKPEPAASDGKVPGKLLHNDAEFESAIRPDNDQPDEVRGVLVKARSDPDHWLTAGVADTVQALVQGRMIFTPIKLDKGVNAAVFLGADKLLASGYLWQENRQQLAYKPLTVVQKEGQGWVIGFTADPNFRAFVDGLNTLFLNAVFRGPAHAR